MSDKKKPTRGDQAGGEFLLDDIDTRSVESAMQSRMREEREQLSQRAGQSAISFPDIDAPGLKSEPADPYAAPTVRRVGPMKITPPSAAPGSLLGNLRQAAMAQQKTHAKEAQHKDAMSVRMDYALRQVFSYLHELVQLLNQLKPEIDKEYLLSGNEVFSGMSWREGFCDYRSQSDQGGLLLESVGFSYHLASPRVLTVDREEGQIEKFRTTLFENALPFTCDEFRNDRHHVERTRFKVPVEVKVHVDWQADFERGIIVVNGRNLGRFGMSEYLLKPASITEALLEQFSNMVMGQPNRFPSMVRAQSPT